MCTYQMQLASGLSCSRFSTEVINRTYTLGFNKRQRLRKR